MTTRMVRITTYSRPDLLNEVKQMALDDGRKLYELFNQGLELLVQTRRGAPIKRVLTKKLTYRELMGPPLNARLRKKNLTRADYYDIGKF